MKIECWQVELCFFFFYKFVVSFKEFHICIFIIKFLSLCKISKDEQVYITMPPSFVLVFLSLNFMMILDLGD